MTSQIAIMNYTGIAIASDTMTSISYESGTKTIPNTSKIWELGPKHAVAVLHSGSTSINGITHGMHFNEWARTLEAPLPTLKQYVDSYLAFSSHSQAIVPAEAERDLVESYVDKLYSNIRFHVDKYLLNWNEEENRWYTEGEDEYAITLDQVKVFIGMFEGIPEFKKMSDRDAQSLLDAYRFDLSEKIDEHFVTYPMNNEIKQFLISNTYLALSRIDRSTASTSDLAFIGFGSGEPYAGSIKVECRGIYGGKMQCREQDYSSLSPQISSRIATFAQDEAIWGFLRGYRYSLLRNLVQKVQGWISDNFEIDEENSARIEGEISDLMFQSAFEIGKQDYTNPMFDSIEGMSVHGIAELAESLVGIQSTSTYAETGTATVGGLIEVATIDRKNGFVWRKKAS